MNPGSIFKVYVPDTINGGMGKRQKYLGNRIGTFRFELRSSPGETVGFLVQLEIPGTQWTSIRWTFLSGALSVGFKL